MTNVQCPSCGEMALQVHSPGEAKCLRCGAEFRSGKRLCPLCGALNELEVESCQACQEPLTVFETVLSRQKAGLSSYRLETMRDMAADMQAQSARHSDERMAEFTAIDQRRIEAEREAALNQGERDLRLLRYVKIGFGIFLAVLAIISLIVIL
jgi:predicted amidophosphoribosyltransferase